MKENHLDLEKMQGKEEGRGNVGQDAGTDMWKEGTIGIVLEINNDRLP